MTFRGTKKIYELALQASFCLVKKIRSIRKELGLSQESLAYDADLDRAYLRMTERGEKNIVALKLLQINDALKIPKHKLIDF